MTRAISVLTYAGINHSKWITPEERESALAEQMEKLRGLIKESELRALVLPGNQVDRRDRVPDPQQS